MHSAAIQTLIDAVEAQHGPVTLRTGDDDGHGIFFGLADVPASFSVHTQEGRLPPNDYDIQIEDDPPGDYVYTSVVSLTQFLELVAQIAGAQPDELWPSDH
jgi:hypothetical protein